MPSVTIRDVDHSLSLEEDCLLSVDGTTTASTFVKLKEIVQGRDSFFTFVMGDILFSFAASALLHMSEIYLIGRHHPALLKTAVTA